MQRITPSQTVGPYFHIGLDWPDAWQLATGPATVTVHGQVSDGLGKPVTDALLELWQADAAGRYVDAVAARAGGFSGFGRAAVDSAGSFRFQTIKPGRVAAADGRSQAPHLNLAVFARGLLRQLHTRIYFADEVSANDVDPVLACVPVARRETLLATPAGEAAYRFDLRLQGEAETVFFDV